jgi:hypothetical protein
MFILALVRSAGTNDVQGAINLWLRRSRRRLSPVAREKHNEPRLMTLPRWCSFSQLTLQKLFSSGFV